MITYPTNAIPNRVSDKFTIPYTNEGRKFIDFAIRYASNNKYGYSFLVSNNAEGLEFIELARKFKNAGVKITPRGRNKNRKAILAQNSISKKYRRISLILSVPKEYADRFAIYVR